MKGVGNKRYINPLMIAFIFAIIITLGGCTPDDEVTLINNSEELKSEDTTESKENVDAIYDAPDIEDIKSHNSN